MFPILYDKIDTVGTVPTNNGLGILTDCLECMVTEKRNGSYELTLKYPVSGLHAKELVERRIIKAKPNYTDDPQLFRIYNIGKVINDTITVNARHISYDLSGYPITTGSATNAVMACDLLQNNASGWNITTNKDVQATFKIDEPSSVRSWFGGKEGSLLDVFGTADWKYDNFTCSFLTNRGTNRGVKVKYAKNLISLDQDIDSSNVITAVLAYWKDSQTDTVVIGNTQSTSVVLDVPNVYTLDCSSEFQDPPTVAQLNTKAQNYITNHETAFAKQNIKLNFLQLGLLKDRVDLCDTVTIEYEDFGITGTAKCITTTWDVLKDRYDSIEVGEPKTNIADTIVSLEKTDKNKITPTEMTGAISRATALITGNSGGYVVLHDSNADGKPDELLIMNTEDIATATKVWRWNLSGLGYSRTGYDGNYGLAMTMDGEIDCSFLRTGTLVFGGTVGNTDGSLTIKDQNNNVIANFNKSGCTVKGNIYATSFVADAGSDTEVAIGARAADGGYVASNGIYIYDEDATTPTKPMIELSSYGYGSYLIMANNESQQLFSVKVDGQGQEAGLFMHANDYNRHTTPAAITLESCFTTGSGERVSGKFKVLGYKYSGNYPYSTNDYCLAYDGNSNPADIYLGGMYLEYGALQGHDKGDLRQITLRGDGSKLPVRIELWDNNSEKILLDGKDGHIVCVSLTQTSSRKYKENIEELTEDEAKKVLLLVPASYDFKNNPSKNRRGFIAEEVNEVIPEVVSKDDNGEPEGIYYTDLIPYLTKMIQVQQEQINKLESRINELEKGVNDGKDKS
jgi:phage minor structural protein